MPLKEKYDKVPTTVYLTPTQYKAIKVIHDLQGIPCAEVIRRGVNRYLLDHLELSGSLKRRLRKEIDTPRCT